MSAPDRPTREQVEDAMQRAAIANLPWTLALAAEVRALRAEANCGEGHDPARICCAHAGEVRALRAELDDPHDGHTCAETEARCEDLEGQVNDASMALSRAGHDVDIRHLGRSVRAALVARTPQPAGEPDDMEFAGAYAWGGGAPNGAPIPAPHPAEPQPADGWGRPWGSGGHGNQPPEAPLPAVPDGPTPDAEADLTPAELRVHAATLRTKGYHGAALTYEGMADFADRVAAPPGPPAYCDDMAGPSGVGGPCVLPPGHPHVDGIGGQWPAVPDGEDARAVCPLCHRTAALVFDAHGHFGPDIEAEDEVICDGSHWRPSWVAEKAAGGRPDISRRGDDGEDVPARLDAAADVCDALGWIGTANTFHDLASQLREWDEEAPAVRAAVAAALARPTGGEK